MSLSSKAAVRIPLGATLVALTALIAVNISAGEPVEEAAPPHVPAATQTTPPPPPPPPGLNELPAPDLIGSLTMEGAGGESIISGATYDSMDYVLPLNPAGPQETMTRWVKGWGVPPSEAEQGTVYVLGHAWAVQPLVFNPISEKVTAAALGHAHDPEHPLRLSTDILNGSVIQMIDDQGRGREWVVDDAWMIDKYQAIDDANLMDGTIPGRIILIACSVSGENDLGYNVVVSGHLKEPGETEQLNLDNSPAALD